MLLSEVLGQVHVLSGRAQDSGVPKIGMLDGNAVSKVLSHSCHFLY